MKIAKKDLTINYWPRLTTAKGKVSQIDIRYLTDKGEEFHKSIRGDYNESEESLFAKAPAEIHFCELCYQETDIDELRPVLITGPQARRGHICTDCICDDSNDGKWRPAPLNVFEMLATATKPENIN